MECSEAYRTLADPERRAAYDRDNSLRRLNFFRDVDVSGAGPAAGLAGVGAAGGGALEGRSAGRAPEGRWSAARAGGSRRGAGRGGAGRGGAGRGGEQRRGRGACGLLGCAPRRLPGPGLGAAAAIAQPSPCRVTGVRGGAEGCAAAPYSPQPPGPPPAHHARRPPAPPPPTPNPPPQLEEERQARRSPFRWADLGQDSDNDDGGGSGGEGSDRGGPAGAPAFDKDPLEFLEELARWAGAGRRWWQLGGGRELRARAPLRGGGGGGAATRGRGAGGPLRSRAHPRRPASGG
jgi:hypothetical protein